jgi:hypothetical protein
VCVHVLQPGCKLSAVDEHRLERNGGECNVLSAGAAARSHLPAWSPLLRMYEISYGPVLLSHNVRDSVQTWLSAGGVRGEALQAQASAP